MGTGGTIASVQSEAGLAPGLDIDRVLSFIPRVRQWCAVSTLQLFAIDSTNITPAHWTAMVDALEQRWQDYDGFVICHGTDTLAYTAAALSYMIQNADRPVVITGAQKPIDLEDTDARVNLEDSFRYAADPGSRGVSIVFGGKVIAGTRARKERTRSASAFSSINFPYPAVVQDGAVVRYFEEPPAQGPVRFARSMKGSVCVLKLVPGLDAGILPAIFARCDALVIESFGVGGMPDHLLRAFQEEMALCKDTKMVVMATQVPKEGSNMTVYEVGRRVRRDWNLMEACDMTLEAVVTKLMWLMGLPDISMEERRAMFYRTVNHDILFARIREAEHA